MEIIASFVNRRARPRPAGFDSVAPSAGAGACVGAGAGADARSAGAGPGAALSANITREVVSVSGTTCCQELRSSPPPPFSSSIFCFSLGAVLAGAVVLAPHPMGAEASPAEDAHLRRATGRSRTTGRRLFLHLRSRHLSRHLHPARMRLRRETLDARDEVSDWARRHAISSISSRLYAVVPLLYLFTRERPDTNTSSCLRRGPRHRRATSRLGLGASWRPAHRTEHSRRPHQ